MTEKEKKVRVNGRLLPASAVEGFESQWNAFTCYSRVTPKAVIDLLAFTHITGELPAEDVLAKHKTDLESFNHNLKFFKHKLKEDEEITAQMREEDDAKFRASPLYSPAMWNLFHEGE